jgi:hypothetical protein
MMGAIVGGLVLLFVGLGVLIALGEPKRRAAYMESCQAKGFTPDQCRFLYRERLDHEADSAAALSIGAAALSNSVLQRR